MVICIMPQNLHLSSSLVNTYFPNWCLQWSAHFKSICFLFEASSFHGSSSEQFGVLLPSALIISQNAHALHRWLSLQSFLVFLQLSALKHFFVSEKLDLKHGPVPREFTHLYKKYHVLNNECVNAKHCKQIT